MKRTFNLIALFLVCMCLWSCGGTSENNGGIEVIDIGNAAQLTEDSNPVVVEVTLK